MKRIVVAVSVFSLALGALAQETSRGSGQPHALQTSEPTPQAGSIFRRESSKPQPAGRVHTTYVLRSTDGSKALVVQAPAALNPTASSLIGPLATTEMAETPQSLGCLYVASPLAPDAFQTTVQVRVAQPLPGTARLRWSTPYDNPNAASDLAAFDSYGGLLAPAFVKVYANGNGSCTTPPADAGWSVESSRDIEYAHVFAPNAAIILVEACSSC